MPGSNAYDALINMHQTYGWAVNSKVRHPSFWLLPGDFCHMQLRARGDCLTRLQSREQAGIRGHPPRPDLQDRGIPGLSHGPSVHCASAAVVHMRGSAGAALPGNGVAGVAAGAGASQLCNRRQ